MNMKKIKFLCILADCTAGIEVSDTLHNVFILEFFRNVSTHVSHIFFRKLPSLNCLSCLVILLLT
jgi:hypothetical protein